MRGAETMPVTGTIAGMFDAGERRTRERAVRRAAMRLEALLIAAATGRVGPGTAEVEHRLAAGAVTGDRAARERLAEFVLSECLAAERRMRITQSLGSVLGAAFGLLAAFAALA